MVVGNAKTCLKLIFRSSGKTIHNVTCNRDLHQCVEEPPPSDEPSRSTEALDSSRLKSSLLQAPSLRASTTATGVAVALVLVQLILGALSRNSVP